LHDPSAQRIAERAQQRRFEDRAGGGTQWGSFTVAAGSNAATSACALASMWARIRRTVARSAPSGGRADPGSSNHLFIITC